mgnify:CR=1 FL=1
MPKKYVVRLTTEEREQLEALVSKGRTQAYRIRHAHILLKADADGPAWLDRNITRPSRAVERALKGSVSGLFWKASMPRLSVRNEPILL